MLPVDGSDQRRMKAQVADNWIYPDIMKYFTTFDQEDIKYMCCDNLEGKHMELSISFDIYCCCSCHTATKVTLDIGTSMCSITTCALENITRWMESKQNMGNCNSYIINRNNIILSSTYMIWYFVIILMQWFIHVYKSNSWSSFIPP